MKTYKERRLYYFTCTNCGTKNRHSFKRSNAKQKVCKKCKRITVDPNQLTLFGKPKIKHLDTFSGYGGFTQAVNADTIGFSEIEPHAIAVLKYHYPNIKNYGDINEITNLPDFDLLTAGSPCQDLSVAGKQAGLSGSRSGLFFQFIRLLKEKQPTNFIWENVKGALSSQDGWDFARVQIEMAEAGYSIQWQLLNAKYFGVPQSRQRVFIIGHIGEECKREVFFDQEDRGKDIKELTQNVSQGYRVYDPKGTAITLASQAGGVGAKTGLYFIDLSTKGSKLTTEARTIQARYNKGYSNRAGETSGVAIPVLTPDRVEKRQNGRRFKTNGEPMFTLNVQDRNGVYDGYRIRRLTPLECERLMGIPDYWTKYGIKPDGRQYELSDGARYKLCGNGVVVNVVKEIINKLNK